MKTEQARQLAKEKLEHLGAELERGHSATLRAYLATMAKLPAYSLHNLLLIAAQRPGAQRVAGFSTWQRLGRHVRKGEHGIAILAPVMKRQKRDSTSASATLRHEHGENEQRETVVGYRAAYVFDVTQTEGAPLPEFAAVAGSPGPYTERLRGFVTQKDIQLRYAQDIAPARGACIGDTIVLLPDLSPGEHLATLAHELGHQMLHRHRGCEPISKTVRETEAEAVAFVVCEAIGLTTGSASADYVQLWGGDTKTLAASLDRIQRTAAEIIAAIGPDV